jgi:hypothetical protein
MANFVHMNGFPVEDDHEADELKDDDRDGDEDHEPRTFPHDPKSIYLSRTSERVRMDGSGNVPASTPCQARRVRTCMNG